MASTATLVIYSDSQVHSLFLFIRLALLSNPNT